MHADSFTFAARIGCYPGARMERERAVHTIFPLSSARARLAPVIAAAMLVALLGALRLSAPIATRGEAREGLVVRTIVRSGEWILPRREGALPSKPPLFHWIAAAIALPLGLNDAVVRAPSILAAWIVLLSTMAIGRVLGGPRVGWIAPLMLLGTVGFWRSALEARVDMVFTACVTVALGAFHHWYVRGGRTACALVYFGSACAILAKGPAGAVVPAVVIGGFVLAMRDRIVLLRLWAPGPALGAAMLVLGWYALAFREGGSEFVATQILHENVDRFLGSGAFAGRRAHRPLKIIGLFAVHLFPWNLALLFGLGRGRGNGTPDPGRRFLHAWWLGVLGFFALAGGQRGVYLLPLYPAVALLAAREIVARLPPRLVVPGAASMALLVIACAGGTLARGWSVARREPLLDFARLVAARLPPGERIGATGRVSENDVLVLAYGLDRPLPRVRRGDRRPQFLLSPTARGPLTADCAAAIGPIATLPRLVVLRCPER
jgi:4-amino-4-deoxy-L-arabinose transferase-like glycosyltransferase